MFIFNIELFLSDIGGPINFHLKKVYFFVGHPVAVGPEDPTPGNYQDPKPRVRKG